MSEFNINMMAIKENIAQMENIAKQYESYVNQLNSIQSSINRNGFETCLEKLKKASKQAKLNTEQLLKIGKVLEDIHLAYEATEKKLTDRSDKLQNENTETNQKQVSEHAEDEFVISELLRNLLGLGMWGTNNIGNLSAGIAEGLSGLSEWAKPFLDAGFKLKVDGKYIKVVFGSNQIKKLLGFRHKYLLSDIGKSMELEKVLQFDKLLKAGKFVDDLGKFGNALAIAGIGLDVADGIVQNYQKGASVSEYIGDATIDAAVGAGGFFAVSAITSTGASAGASAGAAIGTFICPGIGTVVGGAVGGVVGGVSAAFGGTALYNEIISDNCFGLLPEGESIEQYLKDGATWTLDKIGEGAEYVGDKLSEGVDQLGDMLEDASDFLGSFSLG